jgi:hypothetical protein
MEPDELEHLIHVHLRQLPPPRAPGTLAPRVLRAAAELRGAVPAPSGWSSWPPAVQALTFASLIALVGVMVAAWPVVGVPLAEAASFVRSGVQQFAWIANVREALNATYAVWRTLQPLALAAAVLLTLMSLTCAAFAAALRHVALGGARSS